MSLKWRMIVAGLITMLAAFLSGCTSKTDPSTMAGGTSDRTDPDAPKVIESKELTQLDTYFYLQSRWTSSGRNEFHFTLKKDDSGAFVLTEEGMGLSVSADAALVASVQKVIDDDDMAQSNGVYRVTAGLPPAYQPCYFKADYISGEKIEFTVKNNPYAKWSSDLYDLFARYFSENGEDALYPEKETSKISRIDISVKDNGTSQKYNGVTVGDEAAINNENYLLKKEIIDISSGKTTCREFMIFPDDYYDKITQIIADTDLVRNYDYTLSDHTTGGHSYHGEGYYGMGEKTVEDKEEDSPDKYLKIYLEFESGRRMKIETAKSSEIEGMKPITEKITEYHESLFQNADRKEKSDMLPKENDEEEDGYELKELNIILDDTYSLGNEKRYEEFAAKWEEAVAEKTGHEIKLNILHFNKAEYADEVTRILNEGKPGDEGYPDALLMSGNMLDRYERAGYLWDMSAAYDNASFKKRLIADGGNTDTRDMDGRQFGFTPVCGGGCVTYVKAAWFDIYASNTEGVDSIDDINNYEKYLEMLKYFSSGGNHGIIADGVLGDAGVYTETLPEFWQEAHPSIYYKNGSWTDGFLEPECLNALKRINHAVKEGLIDPDSFELETDELRKKYYMNDQSRSAMVFTYWSGDWMRTLSDRMEDNGIYEELEDEKLLMLPPIRELEESCGGYIRRETPMWVIIADDEDDGREKAVFKALFETMLDGAEVQALWTKYATGAHWDMVLAPADTDGNTKTDELALNSRYFFMQNSAPAPVYADLNSKGADARKLVNGRDQLVLDVAKGKKSPEDAVEEYRKKYKDISDEILKELNSGK